MNLDIKRVKIFVTVPTKYIDKIRNAVCDAGAGIIGNYEYCTFYNKGVGTFKPTSKAHPFMGNRDKLEFVKEGKLEFECNIDQVKSVIKALREAHPYEEPAIDIVPLLDENIFD